MFELEAFDIYEVTTGHEPDLIESFVNLARARQRIEYLAAKTPGRFYVWDNNSCQVLYRINTTPKAKSSAA